jgi:exopolyphosphatase/pppGpp-phosphohydrolase
LLVFYWSQPENYDTSHAKLRGCILANAIENKLPITPSSPTWLHYTVGNGEDALHIAYASKDAVQNPIIFSVLDIGSTGVKFECFNSYTGTTKDIKEVCDLGKITDHNKGAHLNPEGIPLLCEFLIRVRAMLDEEKPDALIMLCTEAMRAAYKNHAEKQNVMAIMQIIADALGVPLACITICSRKLEAILAAQAMLSAGITNGLGLIVGGRSTSKAQLNRSEIIIPECVTIPVGSHILHGKTIREQRQEITSAIATVPQFHNPQRRTRRLCAFGNSSLTAGLLLALIIKKISISRPPPEGGHRFTSEEVKQHLPNLRKLVFNAAEREVLIPEQIWERKIGNHRAAFIPGTATLIEVMCELIDPAQIIFPPINFRKGIIRHALLGKKNVGHATLT